MYNEIFLRNYKLLGDDPICLMYYDGCEYIPSEEEVDDRYTFSMDLK